MAAPASERKDSRARGNEREYMMALGLKDDRIRSEEAQRGYAQRKRKRGYAQKKRKEDTLRISAKEDAQKKRKEDSDTLSRSAKEGS
jgi:hypothetical protein